MSGARMGQRMRVEQLMTAMWAGEDQRLVGVGWVPRGFLQNELQGRMEGDEWNGRESVLAEVRQRACLHHGCRGTGRHESETPPEKEAASASRRQRVTTTSSFYLGSRSQAAPMSLVSKAIRGLFCMDIKYFSLSSNSLF